MGLEISLGKYGQIVRFALEQENRLEAFYRQLPEAHFKVASAVVGIRSGYQKRIKALERALRENVNEMLLEHVAGLRAYSLDLNAEHTAMNLLLAEAEGRLADFYAEAAEKGAAVLAEVATKFRKFSLEHRVQQALVAGAIQ